MADEQQQRDGDVVAYEAFSGLRNDVTRERFSQSDLEVANNIDLDDSGRASRRAGFSLKLAGGWHSLWADDEQSICLAASGNLLYSLSSALTPTRIAALMSAAPLSFVKVNDRTYFANGTDTGIIEQGVARSWGVVPPTLPAIQTIPGDMPCGRLLFTATFVTADGRESGARRSGVVDVHENTALHFVLPTSSDAQVTGVNLYVSAPDGQQMLLALTGAPGDTVLYAGDGSTLAYPLESEFLLPAPAGQLITYYRGRMYVAAGDLLYYSKPFDYERFDLRDFIQLDGTITMLAPVSDKEMSDQGRNSGLFVGTDSSCGAIVGSMPEDFQYVPKARYGVVPGTLAYVDGTLFQDGSVGLRDVPLWITTGGICAGMADLSVRNLTRSRYTFAVGARGAGVFSPNPNQYIATGLS